MLERSAVQLVKGLADGPPHLREAIESFTGSTIWRAIYGESSQHIELRIAKMKKIMKETFAYTTPTSSLVNLFPFLKNLPYVLNPWRRFGDEYFEKLQGDFLEFTHDGVKEVSEKLATGSRSLLYGDHPERLRLRRRLSQSYESAAR